MRRSASLLREPISLLLALAILLATLVTVMARQGLQAAFQGDVVRALSEVRPRLQTMGGAIGDFESGAIPEDALRSTLGASERETAAALEPLSSMPELRGTILDEPDAAAHRISLGLRAELDELDAVLLQSEGLAQVAYRAHRVLSLVGPSGSGLGLDPTLLATARRLWLRAYAGELARVDRDLQTQVDDLAGWRTRVLPELAATSRWADVNRRVAQARADLQLAQDRLRALPAPPEAVRPLTDYTNALGHLDRAVQALAAYAQGQAPTSLSSADQELAAYRSGRPAAVGALTQLGEARGGH